MVFDAGQRIREEGLVQPQGTDDSGCDTDLFLDFTDNGLFGSFADSYSAAGKIVVGHFHAVHCQQFTVGYDYGRGSEIEFPIIGFDCNVHIYHRVKLDVG